MGLINSMARARSVYYGWWLAAIGGFIMIITSVPIPSHAEHEPPLREMVQICDAVGQFRRVMKGKEVGPRRKLDALCLHQCLGNHNVG